MTRLVLVNGSPGSGKSTIAHALAQDRFMTLALDIDGLKHSLGRWDEDPSASGLHARRLALALASEQLRAGLDLVIGQYLARTAFIEDLERLAERHGARFCEFVLDLDAATLARRLAAATTQVVPSTRSTPDLLDPTRLPRWSAPWNPFGRAAPTPRGWTRPAPSPRRLPSCAPSSKHRPSDLPPRAQPCSPSAAPPEVA